MANIRQYIGARYVFKIYENSQDPSSAEWESGVTYEPLTIVTYLNSTYASKKDVPGSVGDPASNPLYWVVTGAYNGQIATLQQQIDAIVNTSLPNIDSSIDDLRIDVDANTQDIADLQSAISGGTSSWEHIFGVIRKTDDGWIAYEDSSHESSHIDSIVSNGANGLDIMFDKTYAKVGVGICVPDETYSKYGYVCGSSITIDRATIHMYNSRPYKGGIQFSSSGVNLLSDYEGDLQSVVWDATNQRVEILPKDYANMNAHKFISVSMGTNNLPNGNFIPKVTFAGDHKIYLYTQVDLTNYNGWFVVSFENDPTIDFDNLPYDVNSNLWFDCWMKKATT
jgi:hypothetical protein